MNTTYAQLKQKENAALALAASFRQEAEEAQRDSVKRGGIKEWIGYRFASSSGLTQEWADFSRQMRAYIKKAIAPECELVNYSRGHFFFSAFIRNVNTGKLAYISSDDVRYSPDAWAHNLLMRTAQHDKDYTGGANCSTSLENIKCSVLEITK